MVTGSLAVAATPAGAHHVNEDVSNVWYPWQAPGHSDAASNARILKALKTAKLQWDQGDAYKWGGKGPTQFDCSGLVYYSFHNAGAAWDYRTAKDLYIGGDGPGHATGRRVGRWEIKPGDIIFYSTNGAVSGISHAAIYLGVNSGNGVAEQLEAMNEALDIRINPYRTSGALNEVLRVRTSSTSLP